MAFGGWWFVYSGMSGCHLGEWEAFDILDRASAWLFSRMVAILGL